MVKWGNFLFLNVLWPATGCSSRPLLLLATLAHYSVHLLWSDDVVVNL